MAKQQCTPLGAPVAKDHRECRFAFPGLPRFAAGEDDAEAGTGVLGVAIQECARRAEHAVAGDFITHVSTALSGRSDGFTIRPMRKKTIDGAFDSSRSSITDPCGHGQMAGDAAAMEEGAKRGSACYR